MDRSGTEYACVQGNGIFDGPNDQASITAMKSWGVNAVRVPLNEACWNGGVLRQPGLRGRQLPGRHQGLRQPAERQRHGRHPGPALDRRAVHRQLVRLLVGRGHLPEADAGRGARRSRSGPRWRTRSRATTRSSSTCSTSRTRSGPTGSNETEGWQCWLNGGSLRGHLLPGGRDADHGQRGPRHRGQQRDHAGRPGVLQRPDRVAGLRADRPRPQPGRVLALLQLQHLQHPVVLDQPGRAGRSPRSRSSPGRSARTTARTATSTR